MLVYQRVYIYISYGGVLKWVCLKMGYPQARWMEKIMEIPIYFHGMMTGGTPILGNLHIIYIYFFFSYIYVYIYISSIGRSCIENVPI